MKRLAGAVVLLGLAGAALVALAFATEGYLPLVDGGREATMSIYVIPLGVPAVALALIVGPRLGALRTGALVATTCVCVVAFAWVYWVGALNVAPDEDPYGCPSGKIYC